MTDSHSQKIIVVIIVGMPLSGKTKFARKLEQIGWQRIHNAENNEISNFDYQRNIKDAVNQGKDIVIDMCNNTVSHRQYWLDLLSDLSYLNMQKIACVFKPELNECLARGKEKFSSGFKEDIIKKSFNEWQTIGENEDFDSIKTLNTSNQDFIIKDLNSQNNLIVANKRPGKEQIPQNENNKKNSTSGKIVILFDLNKTLVLRLGKQKKTIKIRPGVHHLKKLKDLFSMGIYTSCTKASLAYIKEFLVPQIGEDIFEHKFTFHRDHARIKKNLRGKESKDWDTQKPLKKYFQNLNKVILVDDSAYKACRGEEENMILVPPWNENNAEDNVMQKLADILLETFKNVSFVNVRKYTSEISQKLNKNDVKAVESNIVHFDREKEKIV